MSWADIGNLVAATLVGAGGTSAVIWLAVKLSANSIASALSK